MDSFHVVVLLTLVSAVWTCSPEGFRPIKMDEMAFSQNIVAYGLVTDNFVNERFPEYYPRAYIAEFEVKCSYKGGPLPAKLNITNAGFIAGTCGDKNFTVGMEYIAFLSYKDGRYEQVYDTTMEAPSSITELLTFCGLHLDYPPNGSYTGQCQDVQRDGCKPYKSPEIQTPPLPNKPEVNPPPPGLRDPVDSEEANSSTSSATETKSSTVEMASLTTKKAPMSTKTTPLIILPIVTPEVREDKNQEEEGAFQSDYGAVNGGSFASLKLFTSTLSVLVSAWTLH